jgi:hypothetical protein
MHDYEIDDYEDDYDRPRRALKQSGPGIASFLVALVSVLMGVVMFVYAIYAGTAAAKGGQIKQSDAMLVGFAALGAVLLAFIRLALGIFGLFQEGRKKTFAVTSTILNGLVLLGVGGIFVLGLLAG